MELNRAVAENIKRIRKSKKLSLERTAALYWGRLAGPGEEENPEKKPPEECRRE